MINQEYLIIVMILLLKYNSVESIECYQCNSTDSNCGTKVIDSMIKTVSCLEKSRCIAYTNSNNDSILYRDCTAGMNLKNVIQHNGCFIDNNGTTYCFCDFNRCNAASLLDLKELAVVGNQPVQTLNLNNTESKQNDTVSVARKVNINEIQVLKTSTQTKLKMKPSLNKTILKVPTPKLSKKIFKKLTVLKKFTTTKRVETIITTKEPKIYQLKVNDSFSRESFRRRFSLKPEQKINILFVKLPVYNHIINENELVKKYLTTTPNYKTYIMKHFAPTTTKVSQWMIKNNYKKEYDINFKCPSNGLFPHPTICSKFLQCLDYGTVNQRFYVQVCPPGLFFNYLFKYCDYQHNVACSYNFYKL